MNFGRYVKDRLVSIGMNANELANALGKSSGNMSNILAGRIVNGSKTKPPLEEMDRWAEAMRMDGDQTWQLKKLAAIEHCPDIVKQFLDLDAFLARSPAEFSHAALLEQVEDQQETISKLQAENAELRNRLNAVYSAASPQRQAASSTEPYAHEDAALELDRIMNPDEHPRPPAPTYPRPAPVRGGTHG